MGLIALGASATACSSYGIEAPRQAVLHPFAAIPAGEGFARVCVIRNKQYFAHAVTLPSWDNDTLVGATKSGTYFCYRAEPGRHAIRIKADEDSRVYYTAEAGKSYYLLEEIPWHLWHVKPEGRWLGDEEAQSTIADSTYEVVVEAPSDERLPEQSILVKASR